MFYIIDKKCIRKIRGNPFQVYLIPFRWRTLTGVLETTHGNCPWYCRKQWQLPVILETSDKFYILRREH